MVKQVDRTVAITSEPLVPLSCSSPDVVRSSQVRRTKRCRIAGSCKNFEDVKIYLQPMCENPTTQSPATRANYLRSAVLAKATDTGYCPAIWGFLHSQCFACSVGFFKLKMFRLQFWDGAFLIQDFWPAVSGWRLLSSRCFTCGFRMPP